MTIGHFVKSGILKKSNTKVSTQKTISESGVGGGKGNFLRSPKSFASIIMQPQGVIYYNKEVNQESETCSVNPG